MILYSFVTVHMIGKNHLSCEALSTNRTSKHRFHTFSNDFVEFFGKIANLRMEGPCVSGTVLVKKPRGNSGGRPTSRDPWSL
jgi:hypothetical protein